MTEDDVFATDLYRDERYVASRIEDLIKGNADEPDGFVLSLNRVPYSYTTLANVLSVYLKKKTTELSVLIVGRMILLMTHWCLYSLK